MNTPTIRFETRIVALLLILFLAAMASASGFDEKLKGNLTYQAVQKTLKHLLFQGILLQRDKKYYLNTAWMQQVKKFVSGIEENYQQKSDEKELFSPEEKILQTLDKADILKSQIKPGIKTVLQF